MDKKAKIYHSVAALNESFNTILLSLAILQAEEVISAEYLQEQTELVEELRAGVNTTVTIKRHSSEAEDWHYFGKMREATEKRLRGKNSIEGRPLSKASQA